MIKEVEESFDRRKHSMCHKGPKKLQTQVFRLHLLEEKTYFEAAPRLFSSFNLGVIVQFFILFSEEYRFFPRLRTSEE